MNATEMTMDQLEAIEMDNLASDEIRKPVIAELWKRRKHYVAKMHKQADANWAAATPAEKAAFDEMFEEI